MTLPNSTTAWSIDRVGPDAQPLLRNLSQLYVHDMSEWFGNDVLADGSYGYDISRWWTQPFEVYLATVNATPAGYAVVGSSHQWTGDATVRDVTEFFVLRKYRRSGAGAKLAAFLWTEHPGEWLVRVLATNVPAVPFWRKTVTACAGTRHREQQLQTGQRSWHFFRFDSRVAGG